MLEVGTKLPEFHLENQDGQMVNIRDYAGKIIVLYFYPKDNTPGCTTQACGFKALYDQFVREDVVVIGISKDTVKSHQKFITQFDLPFILLADPSHIAINLFGVMGEKMMYGKKVNSVLRTTFVINEDQVIEKVFPKANPETNAQDILEYLRSR